MMGRENGGEESMVEQVDLPVAMEPVRPMSSMVALRVQSSCEGQVEMFCFE